MSSVYERAFGTILDDLHPRLLPYFTSGAAGEGAGTFSIVGTPRRWLWPVLWVLGPIYEYSGHFDYRLGASHAATS